MPHIRTAEGVNLYYEAQGTGTPVLWVHEFAGSCRSFDLQVSAFQAGHRCITFNARGYPPSDVPADVDDYSQDRALADIIALMDGLGLERAHMIGVSMGAAAVLQCALRYPDRMLSATIVSAGMGSDAAPDEFRASIEAIASLIEQKGMRDLADTMSKAPNRSRLSERNPAQFANFYNQLSAMSARGAANTMRGVQKRRPPVYSHAEAASKIAVSTLIVVGADDAGCRKPGEFLARTIPAARYELIAEAGHALNLERPEHFNQLCLAFMAEIDARNGSSA